MIDFAFIDSGTGGIPYLLHLLKVCPDANCVYVGDTIHFPYGEKTHQQIVEFVVDFVKKIINKFAPKVIVIACNTMSVNALGLLREVFPNQVFVGTVPAIKVAGEISKKRKIGLLATRSCVEHPYNQDLKNHFAADCELFSRGAPELISYIEKKSFTDSFEERQNACKPAVDYFVSKNCDVIILGCTHFLNISEEMQKVAGDSIKVIDSREGVVNRALEMCEKLAVQNGEKHKEPVLYVTGFVDGKDVTEYNFICQNSNLQWGGTL